MSRGSEKRFLPPPGLPIRQSSRPCFVYLATWSFPVSAITIVPSGATSMPDGYISAWSGPPRFRRNSGGLPVSPSAGVTSRRAATSAEATTDAPARRHL